MAPALRLRLLGHAAIEGASGPLRGSAAQGQPLALLAVLACAGDGGVARDKLYALLWPEAGAGPASHRLSQLAHHIRRGLGCPDLIAGASELRLNPERVACDIWEFVAARRTGEMEHAVGLYGGPFLDGYFSSGARLDHWVESRRSTLARDYQEALETLAVQAELRGDPRSAATWWRRLADHEPLSSRVTMHLMTALAAGGDRAHALERAQVYQAQVREELDAEPNPAIGVLAAELRRTPPAAPTRSFAIGVLPLAALDADAETAALAQGLTEELTTAAAALAGVRIASRTSLAALQHDTNDMQGMGARLGLAAVVEGSVRQRAGRVRLTVRLVDVRDGCHLWTKQYERRLDEGFEAQDALAREVVEGVRPHLERLREGRAQGAS